MIKCPYCHRNFSILLKCTRCGHKWRPRTDSDPEICPKCRSPYWSKAKRRKKNE